VLAVYFTIRHFQDRKAEKETEKLQNVLDVAAHPVRSPNEPADPKSKEVTYASEKERADAILDALAKANTDAAGPTYKASLLLQAGKLDQAITEYRRGQTKTGLDGVLAREGLGIALEMKAETEKDAAARQKGLEDALAAFQAMQPDEKGARYAYALYHQGRILALLGKTAEAREKLTKAKELGKDTKLPDLIDERLASLGA